MRRFEGYGVMVTGGARGIGAAIARRLVDEGAGVLIVDIDEEAARATADDIGKGAAAMRCDVTDTAQVEAAVARVVELYGGFDTLVNNAFAGHRDTDRFEDATDADWYADFEVTLHGAMRCIRAALPHLAAAGGRGSVVTIGSVNGLASFSQHGYSAAKAALGSLTRTLAVQNAPRGVRVNLVAPGTVRTRNWADRPETLKRIASLYPMGRVGEPEDIAAAVAFLASADASWITGLTLPVDGGILISNLGWQRSGEGGEGGGED